MVRMLALAFACLIVTLVGAPASATDLPLQNPGFEDGPSQSVWQLGTNGPCTSPGFAPTVYDGQSGDPTNVHTGRYSLRYTFNSNKAWQTVEGPVTAGSTITLNAWVKMPTQGSPQSKVLTLQFHGIDANQQCLWGIGSFPDYSGPFPNWTELHVSFVAPSDAAGILVAIHTQNGGGCGSICSNPLWVDDVSLVTSGGATNGACCFPNGTCLVLTANACSGQGGAYQGNDTDCDPSPCEQPPGFAIPNLETVYTTLGPTTPERVFNYTDTPTLHLVFRNDDPDLDARIRANDVAIHLAGMQSGVEHDQNLSGDVIVHPRSVMDVSVILPSLYPLRQSTAYQFIGDKILVTIVTTVGDPVTWAYYLDEMRVPGWTRTGVLFELADRLHGPANAHGNEHTALMWTTLAGDGTLEQCRDAGADVVSVGAEYFNYGRLEGGAKQWPNGRCLWPLKMWLPCGPGSSFHLTTLPLNPDAPPPTAAGIRSFVDAAHALQLNVIGYCDMVGIYSPTTAAGLWDRKAKAHRWVDPGNQTEWHPLGWARYGDWRRGLTPGTYYSTGGSGPVDVEPLVLFDNRVDYEGTPVWNYADLAYATCWNGPSSGGAPANSDEAFSINALQSDQAPLDNDQSFHYHTCREALSVISNYGFDGFFIDNPGRIVETEDVVESIADFAVSDDKEFPILVDGGQPTHSILGPCGCALCTSLRGGSDPDRFAADAVANFMKHVRRIVHGAGYGKAIISSNYYVSWPTLATAYDVASTDKIPIGSKGFAEFAKRNWELCYKPMQTDWQRIPTRTNAGDFNLDLPQGRIEDINIVHMAMAFANNVGMRLPWKRIAEENAQGVKTFLRFFKHYSGSPIGQLPAGPNYFRNPCSVMRYHSFLHDVGSDLSMAMGQTEPYPYRVVYGNAGPAGDNERVIHLVNDNDPGTAHSWRMILRVPSGKKVQDGGVKLLTPDAGDSPNDWESEVPPGIHQDGNSWYYCNVGGIYSADPTEYLYLTIADVRRWSVVVVDLENDYRSGFFKAGGEGQSAGGAVGEWSGQLDPSMPNPARGGSEIGFFLPAATQVRLEIYDIQGRKVRTLVNGPQAGGPHTVQWDGRGDDGSLLPSGVYLSRLTGDRFARTGRLVLVR